jgi:hypothetical protein
MQRIDVIALVLAVGLLVITLELVRRRALREQYSLLWLLTGAVIIGLSLWRGALDAVAGLLGIYYAPSALMVISLGFVLIILLHYSLVISRLTEENKELTQRYAIMAWQTRELAHRLEVYLSPDLRHPDLPHHAASNTTGHGVDENDREVAVAR